MEEKNVKSTFAGEASEMVAAIFNMLDIYTEELTELERQIISAFSFGMINGAAMEEGADPMTVQGTMAGVLIRQFGYSENQAVDFMQQLIESTNREFHPTMYVIIHRGLEGYYDYRDQQYSLVHENLTDIIDTIVTSND
ncbi:Imm48 family immunity protein [Lysinibacillus sp. 3P01SB]|uniref:Imm48 family immunity protein n=1 Tax=Lysinibacillus sp. 3P01SB TaxID=3132284 RepID=UPI0039A58FB7